MRTFIFFALVVAALALTRKGIDISVWQGNVNFDKVKGNVDFVILRAGYGRESYQKDKNFETYYSACKARGIPVGVYHYSYATDPADAKKEANTVLGWLKGKSFEYPIYYDVEERNTFNSGNTVANIKAFCGVLEANGYWCGLYISRSPMQTYVDRKDSSIKSRYALWLAEYSSKCNYGSSIGMWQYKSTGSVPGISGNVDMDYCYVDYPSLMKKYCKNNMCSSKPQPPTTDEKVLRTQCVAYVSPYLNVRSGPSTGYTIVGQKYTGNQLSIYEDKNGWVRISKKTESAKWVSATYVENCPKPVTPGKFVKRTTIPEYGNKYYNTKSNGGYSTAIVGSPTRAGLNVLSNCVGYAAGRFNEIIGAGKFKYLNYPPNAGDFCARARSEGLTTSSTPSLGAIISWTKSGAAGHVAVVEEIYSDGSILTSESGWNSDAFWTKRRYSGNNWGAGSSYRFSCFIKNPAV